MFIHEAVKQAREIDGYIVRLGWLDWIRLRPTDEEDGIVLISPNNKVPRPRWQPRAEDLLADDWLVTRMEPVRQQASEPKGGEVVQLEEYFVVMRVFQRVDGKFSDKERAIVKTQLKVEPGRPCKFTSNGVTYFGDAIDCISVNDSDAICKILASLSDMCVLIHSPDYAPGNNSGSE